MAELTLGEQFVKSKGEPIAYQGKRVHSIFCREVGGEARLAIRFIGSSKLVPQALRVKSHNCKLHFDGQALTDIVLWADKSPTELWLMVAPAKRQSKSKKSEQSSIALVKVWNAWSDDQGVMQAWIGNSGILVEEAVGETLLRCSDGVGLPDFDDLVVSLRFSGT